MKTTEMLDHKTKPHDDLDIYTTAQDARPWLSTIGLVVFAIGLLWLAVTFGGAE